MNKILTVLLGLLAIANINAQKSKNQMSLLFIRTIWVMEISVHTEQNPLTHPILMLSQVMD